MNQANRFSQAIVRSPVLWGGMLTFGFFALLHAGLLAGSPVTASWEGLLKRYTAGHPIEYVETALFLVGLAALVLKAFDVAGQHKLFGDRLLGPTPLVPQTATDCVALLTRLDALPEAVQESYLVRRLRGSLQHVQRTTSADTLDDHLKYLADVDAGRAQAGYAFVRIIIWAIPIMGFLGTVVGITVAIANLSPEALESSLPQVTAGLGTAFDTTAIALVYSTILMFVQHLVDQAEGRLLDRVEEAAGEELAGRFERLGAGADPQVAAVRRMADGVLKAVEHAVERQALVWQASLETAEQRWNLNASSAGQLLEHALSAALQTSLAAHAQQVTAAGEAALELGRAHWVRLQQSLERATAALVAQEQQLHQQGEVLLKVVEATGQVTRLEDALNNNLAALAGSQNFEETVQSLAAVIHLLNARLGHTAGSTPLLGRGDARSAGQAA